MYPQLTGIVGDAYAGKLLADHDGAIRNARELQQFWSGMAPGSGCRPRSHRRARPR